jgi:hypothetical protein
VKPSKADLAKKAAAEARRFRRLISVDIRHDHCNARASRSFSGIEMAPTEQTARRLSHYGLLVRRRDDGIDILHTGAHADSFRDMLEALRDWAKGGLSPAIQNRLFPPLLFTLRLRDPRFFNFTDAPTHVRSGQPALWLSNRQARAVEDSEGQDPAVPQQTARIEPDWHNRGMLVAPKEPPEPEASDEPHKDSPAASAGEEARDRLEEAHPLANLKEAPDPFADWWFEPGGDVEAARIERLDMKAGHRPRPLPLGFVELYLSPAAGTRRRASDGWNGFALDFEPPADLPAGATAEAGGYVRPSTYEIRFEARRTRWRYLVSGRGRELDESMLQIKDGDGKASFERAGHALLPGGGRAVSFESREPLPLRQRPEHKFALHGLPEAGSRRAQKLIDPLPVPSADLILPDPHPPPRGRAGAAGAKAWSEIYVFV